MWFECYDDPVSTFDRRRSRAQRVMATSRRALTAATMVVLIAAAVASVLARLPWLAVVVVQVIALAGQRLVGQRINRRYRNTLERITGEEFAELDAAQPAGT